MTTRWRWPPRLNTRPAAMPILMAISAVMGSELARPRTPSVPKRERDMFFLSLPHCRGNREGLASRCNGMNAHDGGSAPNRLNSQPDRGGIALRRLLDAGQLADEALARAADQDGIARFGEASGSGNQLELLRHALAEADAGIERDALLFDAGCLASHSALEQEQAYFLDDIRITRPGERVLRQSAAMHQHDIAATLRDQCWHRGIVAQCRNVVDDPGAGIQCSPRHRGAARVDRDHGVLLGEARDDWEDPAKLFLDRRRSRARPRRLAPDVDIVGALGDEAQAVLDRLGRIETFAAVGKGVRRDVEDRHQARTIEDNAAEALDQVRRAKRPAEARDWRRVAFP